MLTRYVKLLLLFLINFLTNKSYSQDFNNNLYFNSENEMFCIGYDSLAYRFLNNGAFINYNYGIGSYSQKKSKFIINHLDFNRISSRVYEVEDTSFSDSVKLCVQHADGTPIICSAVIISSLEENDNVQIKSSTDVNGCLMIDFESLNSDSIKVKIEIYALSFSTIQIVTLKNKRKYIIESYFPEGMSSVYSNKWALKYIKVKYLDWDSIKVYDSQQKEWKVFNSTRRCFSCKEALFLPSPILKK
ncbi:MAG: hypothetical protein NT175_02475 [Bacteroidetes bacterium]|nr:hypothetical protein [Bacteroidota bacterium]